MKWQLVYWQGKTNLFFFGNHEIAYSCGMHCWKIIDRAFVHSPQKEKMINLERYYRTIKLLAQCSKMRGCPHCEEEVLKGAFGSYSRIRKIYCDNKKINEKSFMFMTRLKKDILNFYEKNEMPEKKKEFCKTYKKEEFKLIKNEDG